MRPVNVNAPQPGPGFFSGSGPGSDSDSGPGSDSGSWCMG